MNNRTLYLAAAATGAALAYAAHKARAHLPALGTLNLTPAMLAPGQGATAAPRPALADPVNWQHIPPHPSAVTTHRSGCNGLNSGDVVFCAEPYSHRAVVPACTA